MRIKQKYNNWNLLDDWRYSPGQHNNDNENRSWNELLDYCKDPFGY